MNKGLEILMARMDSNPDEFTDKLRWERLLDKYDDVFNDEDIKVFREKHNALHQDKFTELVMKELFKDQEEKSEEFGQFAQMAQQRVAQAQLAMQQAQIASQYAGALGQSMVNTKNAIAGSLLSANSATVSFRDSNELANSISFGGETLTAKMVKKLKRLIK